MSDIGVISVAISGVAALCGGALGTFLIERYKNKNQQIREREERVRQASDLHARDFVTMQNEIWHKRLAESNVQLANLEANFRANVPYLPDLIVTIAEEAIPLLTVLLALITKRQVCGGSGWPHQGIRL